MSTLVSGSSISLGELQNGQGLVSSAMAVIVLPEPIAASRSSLGTMYPVPSPRLFIEDAALLKNTLAEVLRDDPPSTLSSFEHLEYALEVAVDLLDGLRRDGSQEALALADTLSRIAGALQVVRRTALDAEDVRSEATRSVLARFPTGAPDPSPVMVAVGSPFALQLDLRYLVEAQALGVSGQGILCRVPAWLAAILGRDVHRVAAAEVLGQDVLLCDHDVRDTALALWDPADASSEYALFSAAFLAGSLLVRR